MRENQKETFSQWPRLALAVYLITLGFVSIGGLIYISLPEDRPTLITMVIGFLLGTCLGAVIQYFFGTSIGSSTKQVAAERMVSELVNKP